MLIGLVGKPSAGKSTFFKAATMADVLIAAYPFATIEPNKGVGYVRVESLCTELGVKCNPRSGFCNGTHRFVPVEIIDVAGLVEGASQGKGLGNKFLDDLRQADVFIHIIDASGTTDNEGKEGNGDPIQDVHMLETELDSWYYGILMKVWDKLARTIQSTKKDFATTIAEQFSGLRVREEDVKQAIQEEQLNTQALHEWGEIHLRGFARKLRLNTKPILIAANKVDKEGAEKNIERLKKEFPYMTIIPCSADSELTLRNATQKEMINYTQGNKTFETDETKINEEQKKALETIQKNVLERYGSTGVQKVLDKAVFNFLKYIAIFPAGSKLADSKGNVLPDCFLLPPKTTALDFAYHLHTDIGKTFIKAIDVRTKKPIGKEHKLQHRDGIEIMTS